MGDFQFRNPLAKAGVSEREKTFDVVGRKRSNFLK